MYYDEEYQLETEESIDEIPAKPVKKHSELLEWIQAIVIGIVLTIIVRTFLFTAVLVEGDSMVPTLHTGDRIFAVKVYGNLNYGDIVVFKPKENPNRPYIKRVIATEGQTVDIDYYTSEVKVDGVILDEPFIKDQEITQRGDLVLPAKVPADTVFVMGDNRNNSHDSRATEVGMVDKSTIIGKAVWRMWPFGKSTNMSVDRKTR